MANPASDRARMAGEVLQRLQRTVRFHRLYPHDHQFCQVGIEETFQALTDFHRAHGPLELEVGIDGLFVDEELVLPEGKNSGDLVTLLYGESIREVVIETELPRNELTKLIEILAAPYRDGEEDAFADDLSTALWREDLRYLSYQTRDPLAAGVVRTSKETGVTGALLERIRGLVDSLGGSLEARAEEADLSSDGYLARLLEQEGETLDDKADWATQADRALQRRDTDEGRERKRLVEELGRLGAEDNLNRAAEVVAWSTGSLHPGVRDADAARFLSGSALHALSSGDLQQASKLASMASQVSGERSAISIMVAARLSSPEGIRALSRTLALQASQLPGRKLASVGLQYLQQLGASAVEGTCDSYGEVEDPRVRRVLMEFLTAHASAHADSIARLTRHPDRTIASEAAELLAAQGPNSAGFSALLQLSKQQVGVATQRVLELTGEGERQRRARTVLTSDSRGSRMLALTGLAGTPDPRTYEDLHILLQGEGLHGRDAEEIGATLDLLLACAPERARKALRKLQSQPLPRLRGRAEAQKLKQVAQERLRRAEGQGPA